MFRAARPHDGIVDVCPKKHLQSIETTDDDGNVSDATAELSNERHGKDGVDGDELKRAILDELNKLIQRADLNKSACNVIARCQSIAHQKC